MLKEKISLKRLVGLSQEDGEKLLLAAGYIQDNTYCDDKFPYGKPQTDEVARGSGTESMAVRD